MSGGSGGPGAGVGIRRGRGVCGRRGESRGEGRRLCTEGGVSRDVGMRTKITGTACDVSSSRLVWVWVGMGMEVLVRWEWLAGTGLSGLAGWLADTMLQ